jgi:hypothetical protein
VHLDCSDSRRTISKHLSYIFPFSSAKTKSAVMIETVRSLMRETNTFSSFFNLSKFFPGSMMKSLASLRMCVSLFRIAKVEEIE